MKRTVGGILTILAALGAGCSDNNDLHACTEIGCSDAVTVKLGQLATEFEASLPILVEICVDTTTCSSFTVDAEAGSAPTCESAQTGGTARCVVAQDGSIEIINDLFGIKDPAGTHAVSARVRDAQDTIAFDDSKSVAFSAVHPNGADCEPTCSQATVEFQPSP